MLITRAYITDKQRDDGTWPIWIPLLYGVPDNQSELTEKSIDTPQVSRDLTIEEVRANVNTKRSASTTDSTFGDTYIQSDYTSYKNTDIDNFNSYAVVCVQPGINVSFSVGDVVFVTFENNDLSMPIILGLLSTASNNTAYNTIVTNGIEAINNFKVTNTSASINVPKEVTQEDLLTFKQFVSNYGSILEAISPYSNIATLLNAVSELLPTTTTTE